jgi:hypothetical protein
VVAAGVGWAVAVASGEAEAFGAVEAFGIAEAVGEGLGVAEAIGEAEAFGAAEVIGEAEAFGATEATGEAEGVGVAVGDGPGVGMAAITGVPRSNRALNARLIRRGRAIFTEMLMPVPERYLVVNDELVHGQMLPAGLAESWSLQQSHRVLWQMDVLR